MKFIVVGLNHKTAPIEIREKFFCSSGQQELLLSELKNHPAFADGLVLSTCNRTEIYTHTLKEQAADELLSLLSEIKDLTITEKLRKHFYFYSGEEAVRHFLSVTAGLDSLILGEKQILGQVKEAVELSRKKAMLSKYFNVLSNIAIRAGKKAHHETSIGFGGCSISWAAVVMAEEILGSLNGKSVLIIGAGKMGEVALTQMQNKGVETFYVMNRTQSCALELAQRCNGEAVAFADIKDILRKVDVCICSVGAPHYILEKGVVQKVMEERQRKKMVFIDISMPRNIDPQVADVEDVLLFHIDDLDRVVGDNMRKRQAAIVKVEAIISDKVKEFYGKINKLNSVRSSDYFAININ